MILSSDGTRAGGFAPQALAEITPLLANGYYYPETGINLIGKFETYAHLYRSQPAVATVVDKIANSAARLTMKVYDTRPKTGKIEEADTAYAKLLSNPSRVMSPFAFWRWTFATYDVFGEAYWLKMRDNAGNVVGLEPMHPQRVAVTRDADGATFYTYSMGIASTGLLKVAATEVVPFLRYNPENIMRGQSRLEQLATTLSNEDAARRANQSFWKHGARPSIVLSHPGELSDTAAGRLKARFDAAHAGADNLGGTVVLEEGITTTVVQLNAEEMQYIESRKLNLQEVCMVFDVPPPVVHILDHATYSNITEQMRSMYRDTMSPRLEDVESAIDFALRPEFHPTGGHEARFDMDDVLRGDFEVRSQTAVALRQAGAVTGNEARAIVGLPLSTDPEMDKVYANSALAELGSKPAAPAGGPEDPSLAGNGGDDGTVPGDELLKPKDPPPAPKGMIPRKKAAPPDPVRSIMGRVGRAKSIEELRTLLEEEHKKELRPYFAAMREAVLAEVPKALPPNGGRKQYLDGVFDTLDDGEDLETQDWDGDLQALLGTLSKASALALGKMVAAQLGGEYTLDDLPDFEAEAGQSARKINQATMSALARRIAAALADQDPEPGDEEFQAALRQATNETFDEAEAERVDGIAEARVTAAELAGGIGAAAAAGYGVKTWVVNSVHPRMTHAMVDGETVPLGELFSNGMLGPGDIQNGGIDEVAGCTCSLDYGYDDSGASEDPVAQEQDPSVIAHDLAQPDGGFTWSPATGPYKGEGYSVSPFPERSLAVENVDALSADELRDKIASYAKDNADLLTQPGNYLGGWHDPETHTGYLDVSKVASTPEEATQLALANDQIAYYDFQTGKSVDVNRDATSGQGG